MSFLPIIAGILAMLGWGVTDYLAAKASRGIGHHRATAYILLASTVTLIVPLSLLGINISAITAYAILMAVFTGGVFSFFSNYFAFRAFRYGNVSITAPIFNSYPIIQVLASVFVLGVVLSNLEVIAIAAVIIGILLVSVKASNFGKKGKLIATGVGSAAIAMVFTGTPIIFSSLYIAVLGSALTIITWRGIGCVLAFASGYATKQDMRVPERKYLPYALGAGITDAIAASAFTYAFYIQKANLPIVSALAGFSGGVTVILALILLKERPESNQWLGIALAVIGIVVLSYVL